MPDARYYRAESMDHALTLLADHGEMACMAGGTDLIVQMRDGRRRPSAILDIGGLDLLNGIEEESNRWTLGATVTMTQLRGLVKDLSILPAEIDLVARAAARLGAWQIQNRATIGGNLCNASPAADSACALLALDSEVHLLARNAERTMPLEDFLMGPGATQRRPDEILASVSVPVSNLGKGQHQMVRYYKIGGRTSMVCAIASLAGRLVLSGSKILSAAVALGSVAPTCIRARKTEQLLQGQELATELIQEAARVARNECSPIDDLRASAAYRRDAVQALATQFLLECAESLSV